MTLSSSENILIALAVKWMKAKLFVIFIILCSLFYVFYPDLVCNIQGVETGVDFQTLLHLEDSSDLLYVIIILFI